MRSPDIRTESPVADRRIAVGYDPDAAGSYHPDPEDYPPADDYGQVSGSMTPAPSSRGQGTADAWAGPDPAAASAGPASAAATARLVARRFTDSATFAVVIAGVLGVVAAWVFLHGRAEPTAPGEKSSVTTPAETAPRGSDAGDEPVSPTEPALPPPGDAKADPGAVIAVPDDEQSGRDDDRDHDDGDDD